MDNVKYETEKYKLLLANDLIVYLSSVLTYNMTKQQAAQFLGQAMETWTRRIERQLSSFHKENVDTYKKHMQEDTSDDVIDILVGIHSTMPSMLREEFLSETFDLFQKTVVASKED